MEFTYDFGQAIYHSRGHCIQLPSSMGKCPIYRFSSSISTFVCPYASRAYTQIFHIFIFGQSMKHPFRCAVVPLVNKVVIQ